MTYAELGAPQTALRAQVAAAQAANDPALADLQKQLTTVTAQRETLFKGETLRGLLLTSFGFSVFGVKGGAGRDRRLRRRRAAGAAVHRRLRPCVHHAEGTDPGGARAGARQGRRQALRGRLTGHRAFHAQGRPPAGR